MSLPEVGAERDRQLAHAFVSGDLDAFAIIVHDHYPAMLSQARRNLGPAGQPEDAVQETFERALRGMRRFGLTGEYRLGPWLSRILANVCNDHRARAVRQVRVFEAAAAEPELESDVADWVSDPRTVAVVRNALRSLPQSHRRALVLHELDGLPYAEVAAVEQISVENARARVSRGKSSLRRTLNSLRGVALLPVLKLAAWPARRLAKSGGRGKLLSASSEGLPASGSGASLTEQMLGRFASTPFGQTAFAFIASPPKGTLMLGLAATVATVSASTVLLNQPTSNPVPVVAALSSDVAATSSVAPMSPSVTNAAGPSVPKATTLSAASTPRVPPYQWANPTGSTSSSSNAVPLASLGSASCTAGDGVAPPGPSFSYGPALDTSDAVSVGSAPTTVLDMAGSAIGFSAPLSVAPFADQAAGSTFAVTASACLSSEGWFTAAISDPAGNPMGIELTGTLQEVIGSPGELGYVFRGTVVDEGQGDPLLEAQQFVAQVVVAEPANTAELTIVFLSGSGPAAAASTTPQSSGMTASSSPIGPGASTSTSSSATSPDSTAQVTLPAFAPLTQPISTSSEG